MKNASLPPFQFKFPVLYRIVGGLDDLSYEHSSLLRSDTRK